MKKIVALLLLVLFVAACTRVSVTDAAVAKEQQDIEKKAEELGISQESEELNYDTPTKIIKNTLDEIEIEPFESLI